MTPTTKAGTTGLLCVAGFALGGVLLFAATDWSKKDASTWTSDDARTILSDSPWAKQVKLSFGENGGGNGMGRGMGRGGGGGWGGGGMGGGGMGGGMGGGGGMGRGGGGGGWGGNNGGWGGNSGGDSEGGGRMADQPVTIRWFSAEPVRLATQKLQASSDSAKAEPLKPLDHYIIAVEGFPAGGGRRRRADADSDENSSNQDPNVMSDSMQDRLKGGSFLSRKGHDPIHPDKVAWDNSSGARTLMLYFPKTDPITAADKDVEVQVAMGRMQVKKKFSLKEMSYQGNLDL